jgi:hypothetical protein
MNKTPIIFTEAMRIALSRLGDDDSDEDDSVVRRNMIARGNSGERTRNENKSNDYVDDEQLDSSEDLTLQTSNTAMEKRKRADDAIVSSMHVEASNAGAEEPITTQYNTNANFDMDRDSLERKDFCQPPPSNNGSFEMLPTHESLKVDNQRHRKEKNPEIEIIDLLSSDDEAGLSGDSNLSRERKRRAIDIDEDDVIVIEKCPTNDVATYSRQKEHQITSALEQEILTMAVGVEPPSGDNIVRVQIKMPTGKRLARNFKGDDQVKLIYAFVAQSNDETRAGRTFKLLAKRPPVDLFANIDNSIKQCGLHGEAISVVYTNTVVASNGATMQRSESTSIRSNEAATAKHLQRVGNDGWLKWDGRSGTIEEWLLAVPPTKVPCDNVAWIYVSNPSRGLDSDRGGGTFNEVHYRTALSKIEAIINAGEKVLPSIRRCFTYRGRFT